MTLIVRIPLKFVLQLKDLFLMVKGKKKNHHITLTSHQDKTSEQVSHQTCNVPQKAKRQSGSRASHFLYQDALPF